MTEIIILGAGIVGISAALDLQANGHSVVVVDRSGVGSETSFGNAGIIQAEAVEPHPMPRDLKPLLRMVFGVTNELTWSARTVLSVLPQLFEYYRASHPRRLRGISAIYSQLTSRSTQDHAVWIEAAAADNIIARDGFNFVFRDPAMFEKACKGAEKLRASYGVTSQIQTGAEFQANEPAIIQAPAGAIRWTQSWSCTDPGGLTRKYAELFVQQGGEILQGDAETLTEMTSGWTVETTTGQISGSDVVVALGPWAPQFLKQFGYKIPMLLKRGYHDHFTPPNMPRLPFVDTASGVLAAPMSKGLRVSCGVALVAHDAPPNPRQLNRGTAGLSQMMDLGARVQAQPWVGTRPFIPDMLPVVGRAPRHRSMWFNFGHGHEGFTLAPTTARLLTDAMAGANETQDLQAALDPQRFA